MTYTQIFIILSFVMCLAFSYIFISSNFEPQEKYFYHYIFATFLLIYSIVLLFGFGMQMDRRYKLNELRICKSKLLQYENKMEKRK